MGNQRRFASTVAGCPSGSLVPQSVAGDSAPFHRHLAYSLPSRKNITTCSLSCRCNLLSRSSDTLKPQLRPRSHSAPRSSSPASRGTPSAAGPRVKALHRSGSTISCHVAMLHDNHQGQRWSREGHEGKE
ncbi:hypothetical protein BD311DRAFT_755839 [Dichomitus squalens]|uniref:Uncharacterized protein n=1 Tax=Dichomitus squalens TaxID=114155 RepID=A0A4Q9MTZ2_9APHY|nr:hypothetical protein BD311DRAFT_755839 [Dichomitus squalens]